MRAGSTRRLETALAWRFLGGGRRSRLLGGTALSAFAATSLGVAAMVVAMALMTGYRHDLERKLAGGTASLVVYPLLLEASSETAAVAVLASIEGVERTARVAYGQGSLSSRAVPDGIDISLRGVEGAPELAAAGPLEPFPAGGPPPTLAPDPQSADSLPGVVLGRELAHRLAPEAGEPLRLMALGFSDGRPRFAYRSVRAVGTFASGLSEFDRRLALVDRELLNSMTRGEAGPGPLEVRLTPGSGPEVAERVRAALGDDYLVRDWRELNQEFFSALELQQLGLFFVLGLIVLVSTFNVASSLVVLVRERMREIGVLAALGLEPRSLRAIFLLYGGAIGLAGTALGVGVGWAIAFLLTRFELIRFDADVAEVYFLSSVSFEVRAADVGAVVLFTLAVTLAACWLPARRAATVRPATALRYE